MADFSATSLDYVEIPSCATRYQASHPTSDNAHTAPKVITSLPHPEFSSSIVSSPTSISAQSGSPLSPSKIAFNSIPQLLLSSALSMPANASATPRSSGLSNSRGISRLVSTRDPLSIPITTVNFKRFVSRVGPVFWLQDRLEEIVMWRKGSKYTAVWMAAYAFLCYFPRMILLLPHITVLSVMLVTHPTLRSKGDPESAEPSIPTPPPAQTGEGSVDWLANVQAIQNLMGVFSDFYDCVLPAVPYLTHASPYSPVIFSLMLLTLFPLILAVSFLPLRPTFLFLGLFPLFCTHPFTRNVVFPAVHGGLRPLIPSLRTQVMRVVDNDRLEDKHWRTDMREVELYENERWNTNTAGSGSGEDRAYPDAGWSKANLKPGERKAWTRGSDGWSGISEDGSGEVSSNLTFSLSPGWHFVETEDWRPDVEGSWAAPGYADDGWVYTNDAWMDPHLSPLDDWKVSGMTRRRRWTRRIYYYPEFLKE